MAPFLGLFPAQLKRLIMAKRKENKNERQENERHNEKIAHKRQTGAQNNGGENREDIDDQFDKDLKASADRKSRG